MRKRNVGLVTIGRGIQSQVGTAILVGLLALAVSKDVLADPQVSPPTQTVPDPAPRSPAAVPAPAIPPMWNLDGLYVWLGPTGAASWIQHGGQPSGSPPEASASRRSTWDSTFGADLTVVRVRERERLGVIGGTFAASRSTVRGGGRLSLDAVLGTRAGRMIGLSLGPLVELSDVAHPRIGGAFGVWGFVGVTPFVRVGIVEQLGAFVELGVHIALPVFRR